MIRRSVQFPLVLAALAASCLDGRALAASAKPSGPKSPAKACAVQPAVAEAASPRLVERVISAGESQVLQFRMMSYVAIGNPAVADVVVKSGNELLLNGKAPGETNLLVWDKNGRSEYRIAVTAPDQPAAPDLQEAAAAVRRELGSMPVEVSVIGDNLFLTGAVPTAEARALAGAIAAAHQVKVQNFLQVAEAPKATPTAAEVAATLNRIVSGTAVTARVIDDHTVALEGNIENKDSQEQMRQVAQSVGGDVRVVCFFHPANPRMRQVLVRTRVIEVDKLRTRNLGIDWGAVAGGIVSQPILVGPHSHGIGAAVTALEQQNAARVLAEPNLLVMEGNKGSVLIGGEIPVPIAQASGGGTTVTVQYKTFGINLGVEVLGIDEKGISLHVQPEVSTLDDASGVKLNGFQIPGLMTRRAETTVRIRPGESLAIGGLLENTVSKDTQAIPFLSKIPILGELFKSSSFKKGETELVILVTPELKEDK